MTGFSGEEGGDAVAIFRHDLGAGGALFAYPAVPAAEPRWGDRAATHLYGTRTQSPRTPYLCLWRDAGPSGARSADGAPSALFLTGFFGTEAWEPPTDLMQEAMGHAERRSAVLRAQWLRDGADWHLTRLEVEIARPGEPSPFRSVHFDAELTEIDLWAAEVAFPAAVTDLVRFRLAATLPARMNRGNPAAAPRVAVVMEGIAQPMPDWVNY